MTVTALLLGVMAGMVDFELVAWRGLRARVGGRGSRSGRVGRNGGRAQNVLRLLETENEFAGLGVTETAADDHVHINGVGAETFEHPLAVAEGLFLQGEALAGVAFDLSQAGVFLTQLPELPETVSGKRNHRHKEEHVNERNESLVVHARNCF